MKKYVLGFFSLARTAFGGSGRRQAFVLSAQTRTLRFNILRGERILVRIQHGEAIEAYEVRKSWGRNHDVCYLSRAAMPAGGGEVPPIEFFGHEIDNDRSLETNVGKLFAQRNGTMITVSLESLLRQGRQQHPE